jgi:hypothetical protein
MTALTPEDAHFELRTSWDDDVSWLLTSLENDVTAGFTGEAQLRSTLLERLEEHDMTQEALLAALDLEDGVSAPATGLELLTLAFDHLVARQRTQEASWPAVTDADRLTEAFALLEARGVLARMDFTCCSSCGHYEVADEVTPGTSPDGYAFFHQQDTEAMLTGRGVHLAYGSFKGDDDASAAAVARTLVEVLETAGLEPEWDGSANSRVLVPLHWRKRLPA